MRETLVISNIGELGRNLKEMMDKLEELVVNSDIYIETLNFDINLENKDSIFNTLRFAIEANSQIISHMRKETAKTRKKGDVGKKKSLSENQELNLISYMNDGHTRQSASEIFGVSISTVSRILRKHNVQLKRGPKK